MRSLVILLCLICTSVFAAETAPKKRIDKTIEELKSELKSEKQDIKKFYIQSEIVNRYAYESLTAATKTEAKKFAEELLKIADQYPKNWNYGNAIHHSNLVLGRIKLYENDLNGAKEFLNRAARTPGSPQLGSFGPNMTLAKELLDKGEKEAVLRYLDDSLKFWQMNDVPARIDAWKKAIRAGSNPDFGANLVY